jgi:hypothetical protein|tara:strand:- start:4399 stop:5523 length:1125 start_codon:yes stop_codon:yes gene_type:complete
MGLMSDLKEFGQNFVLSAGTQIAENIKKRGEEDRKAVAEHVKLLRSNIAKNKALDNKLKAGLQGQLNFVLSNTPDAPVGFIRDIMSSDENFAAFKKAVQADTNKTGYWFKDMAKQYNIANPEDIYKASDRKKVKLSDIRTSKGTYAPAVEEEQEKDMSLEDIFKLGFGVPDPVESMRRAERRIVASGRGTLLEPDTQYAYGTPTRGIQPSGLPFSIRGKMTRPSAVHESAKGQLLSNTDLDLFTRSKDIRKEMQKAYANLKPTDKLVQEKKPLTQQQKEDRKKNTRILFNLKQMTAETSSNLKNRIFDIIANRNSTVEAVTDIQKILPSGSKREAQKIMDMYTEALTSLSKTTGAIQKSALSILKEGTGRPSSR